MPGACTVLATLITNSSCACCWYPILSLTKRVVNRARADTTSLKQISDLICQQGCVGVGRRYKLAQHGMALWLASHNTVLKLQSDCNAQIPFLSPGIVSIFTRPFPLLLGSDLGTRVVPSGRLSSMVVLAISSLLMMTALDRRSKVGPWRFEMAYLSAMGRFLEKRELSAMAG